MARASRLNLLLGSILLAACGTTPLGAPPGDGAPVPDGGLVADGGAPPDGGSPADGGPLPDGGPPGDGGPLEDGGPLLDGGPLPDGGTPADGGPQACASTLDCPPDQACREGRCVARGTVALCGTCSSDADCREAGAHCILLGTARVCGKGCSGSPECPSGFACNAQRGQCVPLAERCSDNCVLASCSDGTTCDVLSGFCTGPKHLCDPCTNDTECGQPTDRCVRVDGGAPFCSQDCNVVQPGGRPCPDGFICRGLGGGVRQCFPNGGQCVAPPCVGVVCNPPERCNPVTNQCEDATLGQCATDADCASDPTGATKCDLTYRFCYNPQGTCVGNPQCAPGQTCVDPGFGPRLCAGCDTQPYEGYCPGVARCIPNFSDWNGPWLCVAMGGGGPGRDGGFPFP
jgi:hypothetical protein